MKNSRLTLIVPLTCLLVACAESSNMTRMEFSSGAQTTGVGSTSSAGPQRELATSVSELASLQERLGKNEVVQDFYIADDGFRMLQAAGIQGDVSAALRIADMYERGTTIVPKNDQRMLQWLLHASALNSGVASYRLYQYYLSRGLDREAVFFENRAVNQGYMLPARLDMRRG